MGKTFIAIGDIHGCCKTLKALWQKISHYQNALYIFIGDYIDRGADSKNVVDFLFEIENEYECVFLKGNHEKMLLDALQFGGKYLDNWLYNGGRATLKSYGVSDIHDLPEKHIHFYQNTQMFYDTPDYFFVHAGVPPHKTIAKALEDDPEDEFFLWGRKHLNAFTVPWEKTVVFGHTPRAFPILKQTMIGIDTGCVYDQIGYNKLTAVVLPEQSFIQQKSLEHEKKSNQ